ncbi:hypothetical protein Tco_1361721 [Tanacetum coccineum]
MTFGLRGGGDFEGASKRGRKDLRRPSKLRRRGLRTREEGPLKGPPNSREGSTGRRHIIHPLGEYVITLYINGKLRTIVMVMLVSGAEGDAQSLID